MGEELVSLLCEEHSVPLKEMVKGDQAFLSRAQVTKHFKRTQSHSARVTGSSVGLILLLTTWGLFNDSSSICPFKRLAVNKEGQSVSRRPHGSDQMERGFLHQDLRDSWHHVCTGHTGHPFSQSWKRKRCPGWYLLTFNGAGCWAIH